MPSHSNSSMRPCRTSSSKSSSQKAFCSSGVRSLIVARRTFSRPSRLLNHIGMCFLRSCPSTLASRSDSSAVSADTLATSRRTVPWLSANGSSLSISARSSPVAVGFSAKKSLRSRVWLLRRGSADSPSSVHTGGDCSNFTVNSIDSASNSWRLRATWCRSKSMSHACLLLRPTGSLISVLSEASAASAWLAEKRIAASCAVGSEPEWYSSEPILPGRRAGRIAPGDVPPAARQATCAPLALSWSACSIAPGLRDAVREAFLEQAPLELAADEDHHALALLARLPGAAGRAAHQHVHALEDHAARFALHVEHALVAQQVLAVVLDHEGQERLDLLHVERAGGLPNERLHLVVVLVVVAREELGVDLEDRVQVEAADVEELLDVGLAHVDLRLRGARVHAAQALHQLADLRVVVDEVGLGDEDAVGESHLAARLVVLVELLVRVLRVDHGEHAVEQELVVDRLVHEEGLRDRAGVGEAGRLDDHAVEIELALAALLAEVAEDAHQVAAHRAAQAPVVHLDDLLFLVLHEDLAVDARLAELVLDHGDLLAVLLGEDAVEERCLPRAGEAGEDG